MSYTTDLIKRRKSGGSSTQTSRPQASTGSSYTQNLIKSRKKGSQDFQRQVTQRRTTQTSNISDDSFISTPEKQTFASKTKDLFGKAGSFIKKTSAGIFGSDQEIVEKEKADTIQRIASYKAEGKSTKDLESSLSMIAKIEDPSYPEPKKEQFRQFIRLDRSYKQGKSAVGQLLASGLDYLTQLSEESTVGDVESLRKRSKKKGTYNEQEEARFKKIEEALLKKQPTRDISNKIKKWADDVAVDAPTFGEKIAQGVGSMATFSLISYASKGNATVPYILESVGEAGSSYEELRKQGKSVEEAGNKANLVLVGNLVLNKFLNVFDDIGGAKTAKAIFVGSAKEAGQEATQQIISNVATGRPWDEGTLESGLIGGLLGGGTTLVFPSGDVKGIPADPDLVLNKVLETEISKTKEGQELIKKSLEAKESGQELILNEKDGNIEVGVGEYVKPVKTETTTQETLVEPTIEEGVERKVLPIKTGLSKTTYKLSEVLENPKLYEKYPSLKDLNIHFTKSSVKSESAGITGRSILLPKKNNYDFIIDQKKIDGLNKQLEPFLEIERSGKDLTDAQYKEASKIQDQIMKIEGGEGATGVQLTDDGMRNLYHEIQHAKQEIPGYKIKETSDLLSESAKDIDHEQASYFRDRREIDARRAEKKYKPKKKKQDVKQETKPKTTPKAGEKKVTTTKRTTKKSEVTKNELGKYYSKQDQESVGQAWFEVMSEMDIAEAGSRVYDADGNVTGGISSTFPDWIPEGLRTRKLFDSVLSGLEDPTNIEFPPNSQPRKQELYEHILNEIDGRAGTNSSNIIERIKNAKEIKQTTKTTDKSTSRGKTTTKEVKASKVAVSIEQNLKTKFDDIAGYESINIKDQIKRATKLVTTDLDLTREILAGNKPLPSGLRAGALIKAVEEYATQTGDIDLARQLAISPLISETSVHAQELRLLAERDQNSVLSRIQEVANERATIVEKKFKKKADKLIKEEVKKIKKKVKKIDKYDWNSFIKSIAC